MPYTTDFVTFETCAGTSSFSHPSCPEHGDIQKMSCKHKPHTGRRNWRWPSNWSELEIKHVFHVAQIRSAVPKIFHRLHKQRSHRQRQKQNLTQIIIFKTSFNIHKYSRIFHSFNIRNMRILDLMINRKHKWLAANMPDVGPKSAQKVSFKNISSQESHLRQNQNTDLYWIFRLLSRSIVSAADVWIFYFIFN